MSKYEFNFYLDVVNSLQLDLRDIVETDIPGFVKDYLNSCINNFDEVKEQKEWELFFSIDRLVDFGLIISNLLNIKFNLFKKFLYLFICLRPTYTRYRSDWNYVEKTLIDDYSISVNS